MLRRRQVWNSAWPLEMACSTSAVSRLTSASALYRFCSSNSRSSRSTGVSRSCSSRASWRSSDLSGTRSPACAFWPGLGLGLGPRAPGFAEHSKRWRGTIAGRGKRCATRPSMGRGVRSAPSRARRRAPCRRVAGGVQVAKLCGTKVCANAPRSKVAKYLRCLRPQHVFIDSCQVGKARRKAAQAPSTSSSPSPSCSGPMTHSK